MTQSIKLNDNMTPARPRGRVYIEAVDALTREVVDSYGFDLNIVVNDAREALIAGVIDPSSNSTINTLKIGTDFGETMTGNPSLDFANNDPDDDTITRSAGSWIDDGFQVGDLFTVEGSGSNDGEWAIGELTATVITLDHAVTVPEGQQSRLTDETGATDVMVSRGTQTEPSDPLVSYDETVQDSVYSTTSLSKSANGLSAIINSTVIGASVMEQHPGETSLPITSAALHTGNGNLFAYKRFPVLSISALLDFNVTWEIEWA